MRIHGKYFFEDVRKKYNINNLIAENGFVYCRIKKWYYGLKRAEILVQKKLKK